MRVLFRTDASTEIGTGHVMRCLTLADSLAVQGAECVFLSRQRPGDLIAAVRARGYRVRTLDDAMDKKALDGIAHATWLGLSQKRDVADCQEALAGETPFDWLIVDHYALDARWDTPMRGAVASLMVIDDLADRTHNCDLLLDQTFGRREGDYAALVPSECTLCCGSDYALLRPAFPALRAASLERRGKADARKLLVNLGGIDKDNVTVEVLKALSTLPPDALDVTVVMGETAPWLDAVRDEAARIPLPVDIRVGVRDMAALMAECGLAIGAAGSTTWERCCLGLPTIMIAIADNQKTIMHNLAEVGAVLPLERADIASRLPAMMRGILANPDTLRALGAASARLVDGEGVQRITRLLSREHPA